MTEKYKVSSFNLDHTGVVAPYVRKCGEWRGANGDIVATKFDIRICQPNVDHIEPAAMHALEHLLAESIRTTPIGDNVIDLSPMGCLTGFYLTMLGDYHVEDIVEAIVASFRGAASAGSVPAANETSCGNYRMMDLVLAQKWAERFLAVPQAKYKEVFRP